MKIVVTLFALLPLAAIANADPPHYALYSGLSREGVSPEVKAAVKKVEKACGFSLYSRGGPRPAEVKRCNQAEERALALGPEVARWALVRVDDSLKSDDGEAAQRLYDLVGRSGDLTLVEPMIAGLEILAKKRSDHFRQYYEREFIVGTLQEITFADLIGTPSIQWRQFWQVNKDKTRAELYALRLAEARREATAKETDFDRAAKQAFFLANHLETRTEGIDLLTEFSKREELKENQQRLLKSYLRRVPKEAAVASVQGKSGV